MKYVNQTLLMLLLFTLISSCSKYDCDDCIYFRCKVDGKEWRMNCNTSDPFGCSAYDVLYYRPYESKNLSMRIKNDKRNQSMKIRSHAILEKNKFYKLNNGVGSGSQTFFADGTSVKDCFLHLVDTLTTDSLYISEIDTVNFIIGGRFDHFMGVDTCGNEVHVTDGEFRLNYRF